MTDTAPSASVQQRVEDLIFICERLGLLLAKEGDALKNNRGGDIKELLEEKDLLCRAYESRGRDMLANLELLDEVDPDTRERLHELVVEVEERMRVNTRHLAIEIEAGRRFFEQLAEAAREHAPKSGVYSNSGTVNGDRAAAPKGIPLSVDQSL